MPTGIVDVVSRAARMRLAGSWAAWRQVQIGMTAAGGQRGWGPGLAVDIEFRPTRFCRSRSHAVPICRPGNPPPLAGQAIHQGESETRLVELTRGARHGQPGPASVRLDPQPGLHDLEFQRYRVGTGGVPYRVRDQLGHEQDGGLLHVSQPPGGQHLAGNLPRQPHRQAAGRQRQLQVPPGCLGPAVARVTVSALVAHRLKAPQPRCPPGRPALLTAMRSRVSRPPAAAASRTALTTGNPWYAFTRAVSGTSIEAVAEQVLENY